MIRIVATLASGVASVCFVAAARLIRETLVDYRLAISRLDVILVARLALIRAMATGAACAIAAGAFALGALIDDLESAALVICVGGIAAFSTVLSRLVVELATRRRLAELPPELDDAAAAIVRLFPDAPDPLIGSGE